MKSRVILVAMVVLANAFSGVALAANAKKNRELLNNVLNQTLEEHKQVENSYRDNPSASNPEDASRRREDVASKDAEGRIAIEVGDELGAGSSRDWSTGREDRSVYRESNVAEKLEKELRDVDRSYRDSRQEARDVRENTRSAREGRARARGRSAN